MPFVKKTVTKNAQPSINARKIFIGRASELQFFKEYILKPEDPMHNIVSINGQGGVGKSTLLARYIDETHTPEFKDYCLAAMVGERQTTPASIMEKLADQLHMTGEFKKALNKYKETLRKLQMDGETIQDAFLSKVPDFAEAAGKSVPVVGPIAGVGVKLGAAYLLDKHHTSQIRKDAERMEDPIAELTMAFVTELDQLANIKAIMSTYQTYREKRVILFFDTFEQLSAEAVPWLLDHFLEAEISNNVVLVIAGRDIIEHSTPNDPKRWLPYLESGNIYSISLNSFTEDETRTYLIERGITDPAQIDTIWHLSRGLPLYLGFLTAEPQGKVDPTKDVVDNFLRWIPEQEQIKRRLALDAALFSRPFNQDELEAFTYISEQERSSLYHWLTAQPFVQRNSQDGRYGYHQLAQELFSRHLYQLSPNECRTSRRALAQYYQLLLRDVETKEGKDIYGSAQWLELTLALVNQLFLLSDEESHMKAIVQVINAIKHSDEAGEILRILRELSQEQPDGQMSIGVRQTIKNLLKVFEVFEGSQEILIDEEYLISIN